VISAAALALAAYAFSALFNTTGGNHRLLFLTAAGTLGVSLLVGLASSETASQQQPGVTTRSILLHTPIRPGTRRSGDGFLANRIFTGMR
jgi:hypothetical protein